MLELNDLLRDAGLDPDSRTDPVLVARHSSAVPAKLECLRLSAAGDRALFETYQSTQRKLRRENQMAAARYLVSCIAHARGGAVLVGLYEIGPSRALSAAEYRDLPGMDRLLGLDPQAAADVREGILLFDMRRLPNLDADRGRLEIAFSSPRSWLRKAATSRFPIVARRPQPVLGTIAAAAARHG